MLQETVILIINLLVVNAEMESAVKVNMPKLVQKVNAFQKFQWSHDGEDDSSSNWWKNLEVGSGHDVNKPYL